MATPCQNVVGNSISYIIFGVACRSCHSYLSYLFKKAVNNYSRMKVDWLSGLLNFYQIC